MSQETQDPAPVYYEATLSLTGVLSPHEQPDRLAPTLDDGQLLLVRAFPHLLRILKGKHLGQRLKCGVWPHTNQDGSLKEVSQLFKWERADAEHNTFNVTGRLIGKHSEEQRAGVLINPNASGSLATPFVINLRLENQALKNTPDVLPRKAKRRQGVQFTGTLKNGVLLADTAKSVRLGLTKLEGTPKKAPENPTPENPAV